MGTRHILLPLIIFFLEGMPFFNVYATTNTVWYNLLFYNFPFIDLTWLGLPSVITAFLYIAIAIVFLPIWIGIVIIKIVGLLGILSGVLTVPFSMMAAYPILIIPHMILVLVYAYGIITSIHIAGSGVEPKD